MKTLIIIAFCFLCATAAFAQTASVLSNNPQPLIETEHPQRAVTHAMAPDDNLRGSSAYTIEHGERPLWEFPPTSMKLRSAMSPAPTAEITLSIRKP